MEPRCAHPRHHGCIDSRARWAIFVKTDTASFGTATEADTPQSGVEEGSASLNNLAKPLENTHGRIRPIPHGFVNFPFVVKVPGLQCRLNMLCDGAVFGESPPSF